MKSLHVVPLACTLLSSVTTPAAGSSDAMSCQTLADAVVADAQILSTELASAHGGLPAHCRVRGVIRPAINFELRLPLEQWNGKFYMAGCGGFCGRLDSDRPGFTNAMNHGLRRHYASTTMDGGHWGTAVTDGRWALNDRIGETDWGWRAVTETARVAKALLQAYYGRPHSYAYFAGCSTGGRMALMEAQRFPADFDGIIAGAPALDYTGLVATHSAWVTQANHRGDGRQILGGDRVAAISSAVLQACDAVDGAADGLIDDPRSCAWQPASLACHTHSWKGSGRVATASDSEPGATKPDSTACLEPDEVAVLEKWYGGARDSLGRQIYPGGVPRGSEPYWPLWLTSMPGSRSPPLVALFTRDFLRYMAFAKDPGDTYEVREFSFDRDPARLAHMAAYYDAEDANLAGFRRRGGKLIVYHGWADPIVTPWRTLEYFEAVQSANGGPASTAEFARLFMLPGFDHCGLQTGPGANDAGFDPLPALEAWVERGIAPDVLPTERRATTGAVEWSRPVCAYPRVARTAIGRDPRDAEGYECRMPPD